MPADELSSVWGSLAPLEQAVIVEVYLDQHTLAEAARRCGTGVADLAHALQSAYRLIAEAEAPRRRTGDGVPGPPVADEQLSA